MLLVLVALVAVFSSCGHECDFSVTIDEKAATCTDSGYKITGCSECDERKTEAIPMLGHDYQSTVIAPTCKEGGYTTVKCSRCGDTQNDARLEQTEKINHTYEHVENSTVAPTCTENGYDLQKCTMCGFERKYNSVNKLGHKFEEKTIPTVQPTCDQPGAGTTTKRCTVCDEKDPDFTDMPNVEIPALGHDIDKTDANYTTSTPATCTTAKHDVWRCRREGCSYKEEADDGQPLGHEHTVEVGIYAAATCYSPEIKTYNCVRFGQTGCVKVDGANGDVTKNKSTGVYLAHTPGAAADCDTAQTCTTCSANPNSLGELNTSCTDNANCMECVNARKVHVFAQPTGDHDYVVGTTVPEQVIAPTCMKKGYSVYRCTGCDKTYNDNYVDIDPDAHNVDFDTLVGGKTVAATCTKYEYGVHACINTDDEGNSCDHTEEKTVGTTYADHTFSDGEPTGVITCTCCQSSFYDTTYQESVYEEHEGKEFDENASLDVTITVSKSTDEPMNLTDTNKTGTQVDTENLDTTLISIIRIVSDNENVVFTITVNGDTKTITGSGYVDLSAYGDITSLTVGSALAEGTYDATVYFYGEKAVPATPSTGV